MSNNNNSYYGGGGGSGGYYGGSGGNSYYGQTGGYGAKAPPPPPPGGGYYNQQQQTSGGDDWFSEQSTPDPTQAFGQQQTSQQQQPRAPPPPPGVETSNHYRKPPPPKPSVPAVPQPGYGFSAPTSNNSSNANSSSNDIASQLSGSIGGAPKGSGMKGAVPGAPLSGNFGIGGSSSSLAEDYENEPPLLEELGVNIPQILQKTKAVVLPYGHTAAIDTHLMDDDDLYGPLAYALLLGGEMLLSAKISFGVIYGFGGFGCLAMTLIINLMTPKANAVSMWRVTSILGYSLIPVNFLAALNCILFLKYRGWFGVVLAAITIVWCTVASTRLFERSCDMRNQRYLIAYPISLLYTSFVIITVF